MAKPGPNSAYAGSEGAQLLNANLLTEKGHPLRLKIAWVAMTWRCATRFYFSGAGDPMKAFPPNFGDCLRAAGNLENFIVRQVGA